MVVKNVIYSFKDLPVGYLFRFAPLNHSVTENDNTVWRKTSSRGYTLGDKKRLHSLLVDAQKKARIYHYKVPMKLPDMKVGSINTPVVLLRRK